MEPEKIRKIAEQSHPIFVQNGWTYGCDGHIPTIEELEKCIRGLVEKIEDDPERGVDLRIRSGRFSCYISSYTRKLKIDLEFDPESL